MEAIIKMVTYSDTYLVDQSSTNKINSGNNIYLNCTSINYSYNAFVATPQLPGKEVDSQTHNDILASGDWLGVDNPEIKISGVIEVIKADLSTEPSSTTITLRFLQQIVKSGHIFKLFDYWDSTVGAERFRIHTLSGTFPNEVASAIYVRAIGIPSVDTSPSEGTQGRILTYSLTFREVKNE